MLTPEENALLTQVEPGTPGRDVLRRYWHPIALAQDLAAEKPRQRVRAVGEDLVLWRDEQGTYGLVAEQCSHRGASRYYDFLGDGCLRHALVEVPHGSARPRP